jgi:hypothetical protein
MVPLNFMLMKNILFILFFLIYLPHLSKAQSNGQFLDSIGKPASIISRDSNKLERIAYVVGGSLSFSLLDFLGFNLTEGHKSARSVYRVIQVTSQAAITYFLYKKFGLSSAISFSLIWWTWGDDLGFYGWTNLINPANPWFNRLDNGLHGNQVTWAGWTPIGLTRRQGTVIDKYTLFAQTLIGFSISIAIL